MTRDQKLTNQSRYTSMLRTTLKSGRPVFARCNHRIVHEYNAEKAKEFAENAKHVIEHNQGTTKLWKNISLATVPLIAACAYYVYGNEAHHLSHLKHVSEVPDEEWPVEFEYQNVRWRKFFWGDKTPFWTWANHKKE